MSYLQTTVTATKTADFTPNSAAAIYLIDATAGNIVVTLPAARLAPHSAYQFIRTDAGSHTVTITGAVDAYASPAIADLVAGAATQPLVAATGALTLVSDGSGAWVVAGGPGAFRNGTALAPSATSGFLALPTCAGTPTGTPAGYPAGVVPVLYDTTAHKIWAYDGAAWKATAALT